MNRKHYFDEELWIARWLAADLGHLMLRFASSNHKSVRTETAFQRELFGIVICLPNRRRIETSKTKDAELYHHLLEMKVWYNSSCWHFLYWFLCIEALARFHLKEFDEILVLVSTPRSGSKIHRCRKRIWSQFDTRDHFPESKLCKEMAEAMEIQECYIK